jgi:hypothetical protein
MTDTVPVSKASCRTRKAISITIPEDLLVVLEDERRPKESRSRQLTRLIMKGLEMPDEDYFAILELRRAASINRKKKEKPIINELENVSDSHKEEPF